MTTALEHLKSNQLPPTTQISIGLPIAPAVQPIIVNCVSIVDPELASIIRNDAESVVTPPEDSHASRPTNCKLITSSKTWPLATSVPVVYSMSPTSHVRPSAVQIGAPTTLTKVVNILPEQTVAVRGTRSSDSHTLGTNDLPSLCCISSPVSEQHASMTSTFKHLESHKVPATTQVPCRFTIAPAV
jgi:hypothetical protein